MNAIEPGWVAILMALMTGIGAFLPKMQEWFSKKKKEDQEGAAFLLSNYRETILVQDKKIVEQDKKMVDMGQKLVEVQQKVVDIQLANVLTLTENMAMKKQIEVLTTENSDLRLKVTDLERRIQK